MITLLAICILFYIEAWLEEVVIKLKDSSLPNYAELNKEEHKRSLVFSSFLVVCCVALLIVYQQYYLIVPALISRRIFFDYSLIVLRDRPRDLYEGNGGVDAIFSNIFGKNGRKKELITEIAVSLLFIALHIIK